LHKKEGGYMKIHIHKKYESLTEELRNIPDGKYKVLHTFCNRRNTVELAEIATHTFVIKRYKVPNLANRIIYTLFRKSKAQRAYENALKILRCGVSTPFPVAYIETKRKRLFHTGYFVSEYMNLPTLENFAQKNHDKDETRQLKLDFTEFTISLHEKGILPLDYNPKNIFYYKEKNHYKFALTDINRAKFGKISRYKDTMYSFEQLGIPAEQLYNALLEYTERQELDIEASLFMILYFRMKKRVKRFIKRRLRSILKKQK
jgi:hypothetical protein